MNADSDPIIDRTRLKGIYARLKGIERFFSTQGPGRVCDASAARSYQSIVTELSALLPDVGDADFRLSDRAIYPVVGGGPDKCHVDGVKPSVMQLVSYLETVHHVGQEVVEVGTLYNAIKDEALRGRCADLLSAPGNFDRAINQATQVLEDRIRTKAETDTKLTGTDLVNQMIKADPTRTTIKVSDDKGEQEGFANLCRGMMMAFRNPTHHQILDQFTREDALKVCAFIDNLLRVVDGATVTR